MIPAFSAEVPNFVMKHFSSSQFKHVFIRMQSRPRRWRHLRPPGLQTRRPQTALWRPPAAETATAGDEF